MPTDRYQAVLHFRPRLHARCSDAFGQALREPFFFFFGAGDGAAHPKGPRDGAGLDAGADADGAVGFALFDESHELEFETADWGTEGGEHVENDFDVD